MPPLEIDLSNRDETIAQTTLTRLKLEVVLRDENIVAIWVGVSTEFKGDIPKMI
jgi:hypothetical protein